MRQDGKSLALLALSAAVLVVLGFLVGRWSVQREQRHGPDPETRQAGAGLVPEAASPGPPAGAAVTGASDPPRGEPVDSPVAAAARPAAPDSSSARATGVGGVTAPAGKPAPAGGPSPQDSSRGPRAGYLVQVYASEEEAKAREVEAGLRARGWPAVLSSFTSRGRVYHRVRVGPYEGLSEAKGAERRLQIEEGVKTWIISP